ncbi:hypothetical protein [Mycolicibacterium holsaticum]|jgi:hypothetical protein|uniref:hypothetical protein n=1 Tax=Mycolicibacterium holsaticum TaxID=152142 RepID=UPI001C7D26EF|nr:hypothetical protein [Mycolicibacterium holsaticum]MDA4107235.1 hypothetical protein [Mycolicibacterium holsaticum DSM 44478 = JCM 12374]QZA14162.1 hypothetical protein K3U96_08665 [Mycolicibacterium holsaticum DSM 44478 = JCM 12374]UNC08383.1 hypothetical protein H5U41_18165 [Mycolicibacterium holsaticum DSM 44478 = JCM 12374]
MTVKLLKALIAAIVLAAAATLVAPPATAMMTFGNYDVLTNRYNRASWVWFISPCIPNKQPDCLDVSAISRLKFYYEYGGEASLKDGRYTLTVDVPDGLQCPGHVMPTRDTYSWDEVSLAGTIDSVYDVGCFGGPPGTQFWTFALRRL